MQQKVEVWKRYPSHKAYEVSDFGRVRRNGRILAGGKDKDGYRRLVLSAGEKRLYKKFHTLVLETFVGPAPAGHCACHFDGDVINNRLDNLRWDTVTGNHRDKYRHGTMARGSRHGLAKLTEEAVVRIKRALKDKTATHLELAALNGVTKSAITCIARGASWAHLRA